MLDLRGKYGEAKIFAQSIDEESIKQIYEIINHPMAENSKIRIMPDVHAGKGCVIGTTMTITDKVVPNYVGVDIGCGVYVAKVDTKEVDFEKLDKFIRENIPAGREVHEKPVRENKVRELVSRLKCTVDIERAQLSCGTSGGGNHFIELNKSKDSYYLSVHSGSRYLGKQVAEYYQKLAAKYWGVKKEREALINKLKEEGRHQEISKELKKLKTKTPKHSAYLEGEVFLDYIHDMKIAQAYAKLNRQTMIKIITEKMGWDILEEFDVIHNYIDTEHMIMRKGAISARKGEKVAIPINMRDGIIIGVGKGNPDWNYSAPHGAGRLMSRNEAKASLSLEDYKEKMKGVYSTSVNKSTLDEAPMSYKPIEEILSQIHETVEIVEIIKPVYNFKASE